MILKKLPSLVSSFHVPNDPLLRWTLGINLVACAGCLLFLAWVWPKLPPVVPLYYSLPWGENQLSSASTLIVVTVALMLAYLGNILWALVLPANYSYFARLLLISSTILLLLGLTTIVQIVLLVT